MPAHFVSQSFASSPKVNGLLAQRYNECEKNHHGNSATKQTTLIDLRESDATTCVMVRPMRLATWVRNHVITFFLASIFPLFCVESIMLIVLGVNRLSFGVQFDRQSFPVAWVRSKPQQCAWFLKTVPDPGEQ